MATPLEVIASELLKSAIDAEKLFGKTKDQSYKDKAVRLRRIVVNLQELTIGTSSVATLNDLTDVTISAVANGQILVYNSTSGQWVNQNPTAGTTPTLAQVSTAGNTTTNAITVGGLTSTGNIDVGGNFVGNGTSQYVHFTGGSGEFRFKNGFGNGWYYTWCQNGSLGLDERMRLSTNNNLLINTTTDAGYKLDVNGTARVQGNLTLGNNTDVSILFGPSSTLGISGGKININNNTSVASNFSVGTISLSSSARFIVGGTVNLAGALGRAMAIESTIVAAANNAVLVGLDINPTFTNGAFTGVSNLALRVAYVAGRYISFTQRPGYADYGRIQFTNVTGGEIISSGSITFGPGDTNLTVTLGNGLVSKITTPGSTKYDGYANQTPSTLAGATNRPVLFTSTIADGNIDGFIFENTSSGSRNLFKVIQNNTTLLTLNPNGNLLVGTTTDAGYKLDVDGTARINNTLTVTKSGSSNYFNFEPSATGTSPYIQAFYSGVLDFRINLRAGFVVGGYAIADGVTFYNQSISSQAGVVAGSIGATNGLIAVSGNNANVHIASASGTSSILSFRETGVSDRGVVGYANGTSYMQIRTNAATTMSNGTLSTVFFNSGNVGINSTTDAGYKLDVVGGDARFNSVIVGRGAGSVASNTVVGNDALFNNTTGNKNTAIGSAALYSNETGLQNTAVGQSALGANSTGSNNTAIGNLSLGFDNNGSHNTAVGDQSNIFNTTGSYNTSMGGQALFNNFVGNNNVAIGWSALRSTTGSNNTSLGYMAGDTLTSGSGNLLLGYMAQPSSVTASNEVSFGSASVNAGAVTVAPNTSSRYWNVIINGVAEKVLLA